MRNLRSDFYAAVRRRFKGLLDLDLAPSIQSIPTTVAGINALSGRTFAEWYVCNQASSDLVGKNGTTLTAPASGILFDRLWPGWNGTDYTSGYRALEFDGSGAATASFVGAADLYDLTQSITIVACVRALRAPAATASLFVKRASSAATNPGYNVTFGTGGFFTLQVADGTSLVNVNGPGVLNELDANANGSPQWVAFKMDLTTGKATVMQFRNAGAATTMPNAASKGNSSPFVFGGRFQNTIPGCQVLAWGVLTGANAEAFVLGDLNAIDNWCRVPTGTTFVRYNCVGPIVGSDASGVVVAHHAGSATTTALNHFAHAFAPACTAPGGVGALSERGVESVTSYKCRNRLLRTDDLSNAAWTKSNVTATQNAGDDPSGIRGAARLTASANAGFISQNFTGEADEDHTVSVFAQRDQVTDVAARLSLYDSSGGTEIAGVDITITSTWQRFSLTVPAASVTVATLQWRLKIATSGDKVFATYAQGEYGWLRSYQPQRAALVDRDQTEWSIDNSDGSKLDIIAGRVEVTCTGLVATVNSTGAFVWSTDCGASFEDRIFQQRDALASTYPADTQHYDGAANLIAQMSDQPALTHTDEITYRYEWDSRRPIRGEGGKARTRAECGGTVVRTGAIVPSAAWTTGANADRIMIGSRHSFSAHLEGIITRVRTWGRAG